MTRTLSLLVMMALGTAGAARAPADHAPPKPLADVLACRATADAAARLACFDRSVALLEQASEHRDIVAIDRAEMRETRRSLFGFSFPKLPFLMSSGDKDEDAPSEIAATVQSAHQNGDGQWVIELPDGAVWRQIDNTALMRSPHSNSALVIRRAALGTYFIRVDGQIGFRARRES